MVSQRGEKDRTKEDAYNENMELAGYRKIRRPKLTWSDVIRKYMNEKQVKIEEAQYRGMWRLKTRCADPKFSREKAGYIDIRCVISFTMIYRI